MATDGTMTPARRRWLNGGRIARIGLISALLFPTYYLLMVMPHRGWIDFYQIFSGVQALWRGENPYLGLYYYPPWIALPLGPLMALPYDPEAGQFQAAEAWFWISLSAFLAAMALWLRAIGLRVRSLDGGLFILAGLCFAPSLQSLTQGQSIDLVLLAAALLGTSLGSHPLFAGVALATLTIKPQVGGFLLAGVLLRSLHNRSLGVIGGFAAAMGLALGGSFFLLPTWPQDWLSKLPDGHLFTEGSPAIHFILRELGVSPTVAFGIALGIAAPAGVWYAWRAWSLKAPAANPDFVAEGVTLGVLTALYNHGYDYVLLLLPAAVVMVRLGTQPAGRRGLLLAGMAIAYALPLLRFLDLVPESLTLCSGLIVLVGLVVTSPRAAPPTGPADP